MTRNGWGRRQSSRELQRKRGSRQTAKRCLIVCEGSKTEPNYFNGLRSFLRCSTIQINVARNPRGTDPASVVRHAKELFLQEKTDPYDAVFCVFDRDSHATYESAVSQIEDLRRSKKPFHAIPSNPCFEFWVLLHFDRSFRPYLREGALSPCGVVGRELRGHFPEYEKGMDALFERLLPLLSTALHHAQDVNRDSEGKGKDAPRTAIPRLLEILRGFFPDEFPRPPD